MNIIAVLCSYENIILVYYFLDHFHTQLLVFFTNQKLKFSLIKKVLPIKIFLYEDYKRNIDLLILALQWW